jgi:hypothetical protein
MEEQTKVMIRTYSAGVHYGTLVHKEYTPAGIVVVLKDARRIYSWSGAYTLSDLSTVGTEEPNNCKITMPVKQIELIAIEIINMTDTAFNQLIDIDYWIVAPKEKVDKALAGVE